MAEPPRSFTTPRRRWSARRKRRLAVTAVVSLLVVALVVGLVDTLRTQSRLDGVEHTLAGARSTLAWQHEVLDQTSSVLGTTNAGLAATQGQEASTAAQLKGTEGQLSAADQGLALQGYAISTLDTCLNGVDLAFGELSQNNQGGAISAVDGVSGACLQLEGSSSGGPVYPFDLADPSELTVGATSYMFGTNAVAGNVQVLSSTDLVHWTAVGNALPTLPGWADPGDTWAPAAIHLGGAYVLYYTAKVASSGQQCISVATSASPAGPYVDNSAAPLMCQSDQGGSIDPDPYVDPSGRPWLIWKSQGLGSGAGPATIWSAPLSGSGTALTGWPTSLLQPTQAWEGGVVEAPAMVDWQGTTYLFYSGNDWDTSSYGVGVAVCPQGPGAACTKPDPGPILGSTGDFAGPGSPTVFFDAQGNLQMAFAAWLPNAIGYPHSRLLFVRQVVLSGGLPVVSGSP